VRLHKCGIVHTGLMQCKHARRYSAGQYHDWFRTPLDNWGHRHFGPENPPRTYAPERSLNKRLSRNQYYHRHLHFVILNLRTSVTVCPTRYGISFLSVTYVTFSYVFIR
jgi:hypothetical protein